MIDCVSVANMRQSDANTIANYVPSLELMYRAALGVYKAVNWQGRTAIVVGSGNNGGDGFALALILHSKGYDCTVFSISNTLSDDSTHYAERVKQAKIPVRSFSSDCLINYDIVVDCLLGTGFQGNIREPYRTAIETINNSGSFIVSVDINSGMNGDTGEADLAVHSDLTVTIGYVKTGLIMENAKKYIRKLVCTDIGIILLKEENKICGQNEPLLKKCFRCPDWLDMNVQKAY